MHVNREHLGELQGILENESLRGHNVNMLVVTKYQSVEAIQEIYQLSLRKFGENKVQDVMQKFLQAPLLELRDSVELHFIGTLQKNKVKKALEIFDCIQGVASVKLAQILIQKASQCTLYKTPFSLYLQVNPLSESSKQGFTNTSDLREAYELLCDCPFFQVEGLMTMAPFTTDLQSIRECFSTTRAWRNELDESLKLSMGMSNDYQIAIEESSTLLRIGSHLFEE